MSAVLFYYADEVTNSWWNYMVCSFLFWPSWQDMVFQLKKTFYWGLRFYFAKLEILLGANDQNSVDHTAMLVNFSAHFFCCPFFVFFFTSFFLVYYLHVKVINPHHIGTTSHRCAWEASVSYENSNLIIEASNSRQWPKPGVIFLSTWGTELKFWFYYLNLLSHLNSKSARKNSLLQSPCYSISVSQLTVTLLSF